MEIRAIQKILFIALLVIFVLSALAVYATGESLFSAVFWTFMNLIGADFPPNLRLVDSTNPLILLADIIDIQGKIIVTIILTTIFYQLLGRVSFGERVVRNRVRALSNHTIISPFNGIAVDLIKRLRMNNQRFVVIEPDPARRKRAIRRGILAIGGDPTNTEVLKDAQIRRAVNLILLDEDDIRNTLIAIEAKKMNSRIKVVSRLKWQDDIARMKRAGITSLIMPEVAIGDELSSVIIKGLKQ
jgi:voltage-gated potassium channel Kch